jgi:hypothetical protein
MSADLGGTAKTVPFRVNLDLIPVAVKLLLFPRTHQQQTLELMLIGSI